MTELLAELAKLEAELNAARTANSGTTVSPVTDTKAGRTMTMNMGNTSISIAMASEQDVNNFEGLPQRLALAKGVSR